MRRDGSRNSLFVQRIPVDVRDKVVGNPLAIPLGDGFAFVTPSPNAQAVRFSLRTSDPTETKTRQAIAAAFLEGVWSAVRNDAPAKLSHKQATALAGELYRGWADSEGSARSIVMQHTPGAGWVRVDETQEEVEGYWEAAVSMWEKVARVDDLKLLEKPLGSLVDRLLLTKGIGKAAKPRKLRQKGFYDAEASAILRHAKNYVPGNEAPKLAAVKRFVPSLCAFTGARVGEMLQLRKQDVRREGKHWVVKITPEAGTVKTDEARATSFHFLQSAWETLTWEFWPKLRREVRSSWMA